MLHVYPSPRGTWLVAGEDYIHVPAEAIASFPHQYEELVASLKARPPLPNS